MATTTVPLEITWEKLPENYILPDDPVDNIHQPLLAEALTDSLELAGRIPENALTGSNYGICATVNSKMVVKAPDWFYVPSIRVPHSEVDRSYTPQLQGEPPAIVMEFLSETEGTEYSTKPTYPPGKWFFYEQVLRVPVYVIFDLAEGIVEVYRLDSSGRYREETPDTHDRYWIAELSLFLGLWPGIRHNREGDWLRWWDETGTLLLWGSELVQLERDRAELERERAEQERDRADRLLAQLREAGIEPNLQ
ncbi:Uma2 family endonuclease [Spirulina sp. 06S082]|uniref:Uma2 family endonuclease n=1 Tax=Spirulina sp. 06S082 TaxID=3110248 RepID=UPI002B21AA59|nr:Uma2 family endonuclease [Spirulina sp. 06S082]MEA5470040.1 Uma2 family endonuclease [Spirulina sp. 06S082]